jgi:hypothetical protein
VHRNSALLLQNIINPKVPASMSLFMLAMFQLQKPEFVKFASIEFDK